MHPKELISLATEFRIEMIKMLTEAKSGHPGGSLSAIDIVTALFFNEMRGLNPRNIHQTRDHFILSKGHAAPALYVALAKQGWFPEEELRSLRKTGALLQGHPDRVRIPIVEASTGSLGQGLSVALGMAMGAKMEKKTSRIYCLMGDGESQEGQIWEAALAAPKFKLSNLCAILDHNNGQIDGRVSDVMPIEPILDKWKAFGWDTLEIDGHNMNQILKAFQEARTRQERGGEKPVFILANTIKGKGISFMENNMAWHGVVPKPEEAEKAIEELMRGSK